MGCGVMAVGTAAREERGTVGAGVVWGGGGGGLVVLIHSPRPHLLGYENRVPIIDGAWYHSGYSTSVHRSDMWSVLHEKTGSIDRW